MLSKTDPMLMSKTVAPLTKGSQQIIVVFMEITPAQIEVVLMKRILA